MGVLDLLIMVLVRRATPRLLVVRIATCTVVNNLKLRAIILHTGDVVVLHLLLLLMMLLVEWLLHCHVWLLTRSKRP